MLEGHVIISTSLHPNKVLLSSSGPTPTHLFPNGLLTDVHHTDVVSYNYISLCVTKVSSNTDASHYFVHVWIDAGMVFLSVALNFSAAAANA